MSNISRYKSINNEDPYQLPERNPRDINVVERIKNNPFPTSPHVDDEVMERNEIRIPAPVDDNSTVTRDRLDPDIQSSLAKADSALQPASAPGYDDILTKTSASSTYVAKKGTDRLMTAAEGTKLSGVATGATKVASSTTNGNILINDTQTPVYKHPATHTIAEVSGLQSALDSKLDSSDIANLATKSELTSLATKTELASLATKSELTSLATKTEIANLASKDEVYTKAEIDALLAALSTNS